MATAILPGAKPDVPVATRLALVRYDADAAHHIRQFIAIETRAEPRPGSPIVLVYSRSGRLRDALLPGSPGDLVSGVVEYLVNAPTPARTKAGLFAVKLPATTDSSDGTRADRTFPLLVWLLTGIALLPSMKRHRAREQTEAARRSPFAASAVAQRGNGHLSITDLSGAVSQAQAAQLALLEEPSPDPLLP